MSAPRADRAKGGRPPYPTEIMVRMVFIKSLYNLSDEDCKHQLLRSDVPAWHGGAWIDLVEQGGDASLESSRWLIEHLLKVVATDREMRSVKHQMRMAKISMHRDLAGSTSRRRRWTPSSSTI